MSRCGLRSSLRVMSYECCKFDEEVHSWEARGFQPRRTREEVDELLAGSTEADVRSELIRLGVRRLIEEVLEAEVDDRLGRGLTQTSDTAQCVDASAAGAVEPSQRADCRPYGVPPLPAREPLWPPLLRGVRWPARSHLFHVWQPERAG